MPNSSVVTGFCVRAESLVPVLDLLQINSDEFSGNKKEHRPSDHCIREIQCYEEKENYKTALILTAHQLFLLCPGVRALWSAH